MKIPVFCLALALVGATDLDGQKTEFSHEVETASAAVRQIDTGGVENHYDRRLPLEATPLARSTGLWTPAEEVRPWRSYAFIGALVGGAVSATYFHFAVAADWENPGNRGYGPSTGAGYVLYALPGALIGALLGAALAYR